MPGRLAQYFAWEELPATLGITPPLPEPPWQPRYKLSPSTSFIAVRRHNDGSLQAAVVRYGLLPARSEDDKMCLHNARAESVGSKSDYQGAFRERPCVIPISGYYEWIDKGGAKLPFHIVSADRKPLLLAGHWEQWVSKDHTRRIASAALVTCDANALLQPYCSRMPVLLDLRDFGTWLDVETGNDTLTPLMAPREWPAMDIYRVSREMNSGIVDGPPCIQSCED